MKPKVLCADCNAELLWDDKFCSSCGRPIEWPGSRENAAVSNFKPARCPMCGSANPAGADICRTCGSPLTKTKEKQPQQKPERQSGRPGRKQTIAPVTNSWKLAAGFFVFLGAGILLMQLFSGTNRLPPNTQSQASGQPAANMQAVSQIEEMEKQVAANPGNHELILRLANFLQDNRFYDRAVKYYKDYLAKHPNDANARVDMAICFSDLGNLEEAKQQIGAALKHDSRHLFAHFNMGIFYLRSGDVEKANVWFNKVLDLDPKSDVAQRAQQLLTQHNPQNLKPN